MRRIGIGMKEMDHQGLAASVQQVLDCFAHGLLVEGNAHIAGRLHPLRNFQPEVARDDRHEHARHAVGLRAGASAKLDHVAEAGRGDHTGSGEAPLQHRIGRRGRPVDDEVYVGDGLAGGLECRDHTERLVVDSGGHLGDAHPAVLGAVDQEQVGEGSADVDPCHRACCGFFLNHGAIPG